MGDAESLPGNRIDIAPFKLISGGKSDRMNNTVQAVPMFGQFGKHRFDLLVRGDIHWQDNV